ncbi:MAG: phosphate-starvation-inducible PsiE family protein [Thermaerobacter sp.]|nr:phosphate-starvation-inducible PsiE family protein [Thermaerobacter sp.]
MGNKPKWYEHVVRSTLIHLLGVLEDAMYALLGILLIGAAIWVIISFLSQVGSLSPSLFLATALDRFLLTLMMLELLHTILLFLRTHRFHHEPFLVVGVIAGIRRILVVTAMQSTVHHMAEKLYLWDLSVTAAVVFLLVVALRVSKYSRRE